MVGNKADYRLDADDSRAEVDFKMAAKTARDMGLQYFETSAATNDKVDDPFKYIATEFLRR